MQYSLRRVPDQLDKAIRDRARAEGKSLNEVALESLSRGLGFGAGEVAVRDVSDVVGTWLKDPAAEKAFAAQDRVDEDLWK
jgi:hypothetical protein